MAEGSVVTFSVDRIPVPETLDDPGGDDFIEMVRVRNAIEAEVSGSDDIAPTPQDLLAHWQDPYSPQILFVARVDGTIVGRGFTILPIEEESRVAYVTAEVLAEYRRGGIGSALLAAATQAAREEGRTILQGDSMTTPRDGEQLSPPTGYGSVPADAPSTRFALAHGFRLEQVVRGSRLPLPYDARLADALAASGPDYRVETWTGATPDHRLDDLARLRERMSTDAPAAGLEITPEVWDADRVRSLDAMKAKTDTVMLTAAAEHIPSGRLVAFSELAVPEDGALVSNQEDTLVLTEHRGHRLGMLVKVANLELLGRLYPGHPAVVTFNAEENRPMLDVNEAIGFTPFVYEGAWKKQLA